MWLGLFAAVVALAWISVGEWYRGVIALQQPPYLIGNATRPQQESLANLLEGLRQWVASGTLKQDLGSLQVLNIILIQEANRPIELWYGHLPPFPSDQWSAAAKNLAPKSKETLTDTKLNGYRDECIAAADESKRRWEARKNMPPPARKGLLFRLGKWRSRTDQRAEQPLP